MVEGMNEMAPGRHRGKGNKGDQAGVARAKNKDQKRVESGNQGNSEIPDKKNSHQHPEHWVWWLVRVASATDPLSREMQV